MDQPSGADLIAHAQQQDGLARNRSPLTFFVLVCALTIPFVLAGAATGLELLPGLPVAALAFICPGTAAVILVYRENRTAGVTALLKRSVDAPRIRAKVWYAPLLLLQPGVIVVSYAALRVLGVPLPPPQFPVLTATVLFLVFFISALGEELGWSGYVIDPLQERWGALPASLLLGVVWAAWHVVPLVQAHRSPTWIAWWGLYTVAARVLIVWFYNNTGKSVVAAALFHTTLNVTWLLFPIVGSYFDPRVTGLIDTGVAALVTALWGPRTLAHFRTAWCRPPPTDGMLPV